MKEHSEHKPNDIELLLPPVDEAEVIKIINGLRKAFYDIQQKHLNTGIVLVVGGKSHRLSEWFLEALLSTTEASSPLHQAYVHRIRLSNEENKHMYGAPLNPRERPTPGIPRVMPQVLQDSFKAHETGRVVYIYVDDHVNSGQKAYTMKDEFAKLGIAFEFVGLTAEKEMPGVYIAHQDFLINFKIGMVSNLLSHINQMSSFPQDFSKEDFRSRRHILREFRVFRNIVRAAAQQLKGSP